MNLLKKLNFINILTYLYILFFSFLLLYTFFRAEIIHEGKQFGYYYKYYVIFILALIFWFFMLFVNQKKKLLVIIFSSGLISLLYFYEVVRYYYPIIINSNYYKSLQNKISEPVTKNLNKLDIILKLKEETGEQVVPSVFPIALINYSLIFNKNIFPLAGISNTKTVFCKEGPEYSIYKSDRYGFNNPDIVWDNDQIQWLLLGDSFVQGACVNQDQNFASQFRSLTNQNSINLGMAANGPLIELATLKEYSLDKKLDKVLWFYFERNDLQDLKIEKTNKILMKYLDKSFSQNLLQKQIEINIILNEFIQLAKKNFLEKKFIKNTENFLSIKKILRLQIVRDKMALDRGFDFGVDPTFKRILKIANQFVSNNGGKMYFIYLPDKERYIGENSKDNNYLKRSEVLKLVESLNVPIIDIHNDFFMKHPDPLDLFAHRIYGHYSPEGYHEIAKSIINIINKNELN